MRPVFDLISVTHVARFATSVAPDSPSSVSTSATGERSPEPSVPSLLATRSACAVGSSEARKYWYAPRTMPAALMPAQFVANVSSGVVVPSLTRVNAKSIPAACTEVQSTEPWYVETFNSVDGASARADGDRLAVGPDSLEPRTRHTVTPSAACGADCEDDCGERGERDLRGAHAEANCTARAYAT